MLTIIQKREVQTHAAVGVLALCVGAGVGYMVGLRRKGKTADEIADTVVDAFSNQLQLDFENAAKTMTNPPSHVRVVQKFVEGQNALREVTLGPDGAPLKYDGGKQIGIIKNVEVVGGHLVASGEITDPEAVELVASPIREGDFSIVDDTDSETIRRYTEQIPEAEGGIAEVWKAPELPEWNQAEREKDRNPDAPYVISYDEFHNNPTSHRQTTLEYYAGDDILCDEKQQPLHKAGQIVGRLEFGHGSKDPDIVYIRNEALDAEYEVIRHHTSYEAAVLGIYAEEEAEQADLKHSQRITRFRVE